MRQGMLFISKTERAKPTPDKDLACCVYCRCVLLASSRHYSKYDGGTYGLCSYNNFSLFLYSYLFQLLCQSNHLLYALKIPEFRESLITLCSRRRVVDGMDRKSQEGQDTVAIDLIEPRTLPTDPSYTQQNFEHESMDTKL